MKLTYLMFGLSTLLVTACSSPKVFQTSTVNFAIATVAMSDTSKALLMSTNTTELRVMISDARYGFGYFDGSKVLKTLIAPEDLRAREAALNTLIAFAQTLEKIADPDNQGLGDEFKKEVLGLTASAEVLEQAIGNMKKSSTDGLQSKTGVIGSLIASLGADFINQAQTQAIVDAVLGSADSIAQISEALSKDMELVFASLRSAQIQIVSDAGEAFNVRTCADPNADKNSATCKSITTACNSSNKSLFKFCRYYNRNDHKPWPQKNKAALAVAIDGMAGQLTGINQSAVTYAATLKGFNKALKMMTKVAVNVDDPQSFAAFNLQMGSFLSQAATLTAEVKAVIADFKKTT